MAGARGRYLLGIVVAGFGASVLAAAEPAKADNCLTNKQIIETLAAIHNRGAKLYNAGEVGECYRLFQGALWIVQPMLPKDLGEELAMEMASVDRLLDPVRRAFAMHELIEATRKRLHPSGAGTPLHKPRPLTGETPEPPMAKEPPKSDPSKPKGDGKPLLLEPPKPKSDDGKIDSKPKPVTTDGVPVPLPLDPVPLPDPKKDAPKKEEKKEPAKPDGKGPSVFDSPGDAPRITIPPGGGTATKPESSLPAIPTSNPKPSPKIELPGMPPVKPTAPPKIELPGIPPSEPKPPSKIELPELPPVKPTAPPKIELPELPPVKPMQPKLPMSPATDPTPPLILPPGK